MPDADQCPIHHFLTDQGLSLPTPNAPLANYLGYVDANGFVFISGQGPVYDGVEIQGKVGDVIDIETAVTAARWAAVNVLAQLGLACQGDFERVTGCARLCGYVNAHPTFDQHPLVVNGASDLIAGALGDRGRHSRAAIGVASLPRQWAIEIDAVFTIAI